jgi:hypothetical protein
MDQVQQQSSQETLFNPESALQLAESKDVIEDFVLGYCGLKRNIQPDGDVKIVRFSRPVFTYEFAQHLMTYTYIEVNRITARTDFTPEELTNFYRKLFETRAELLAHIGINHLISDKAWDKVLELGRVKKKKVDFKDPETGEVVGETLEEQYFYTKNGDKIPLNDWYDKYHIIWDYHKPVNVDMLRIIKDDYGLEKERFSQSVILRHISWVMQEFVHGGMARSKNHLTLEHEKVIHKESILQSQTDGQPQKESAFERMRRTFRRMLPGG